MREKAELRDETTKRAHGVLLLSGGEFSPYTLKHLPRHEIHDDAASRFSICYFSPVVLNAWNGNRRVCRNEGEGFYFGEEIVRLTVL